MKVTFVELTVFAGVLPLASGYMEAYCRKDPELAAALTFEKISLPIATPYDDVLAALQKSEADVYAFSCYVWNSGRVRRLIAALQETRPGAHYILGGPQVMNQGKKYLTPAEENVYLCNGEGERTFSHFARALLAPAGTPESDLRNVKNLSFYRAGELVTTPPEPRIADLSEVPSPFLEGIFEKNKYTWLVFETNRGCPFKCNYCYWGAAIGAKVYKYDNERLQREITWISQSGCVYVFIADANWGMLPRDVDLTRQMAEDQKRYGAPMSVYFAGSKNTPERVAEITKIFHDAGMIATQSVALQTMSQETLIKVNRDNIKTSAYTSLQMALNRQGISSFVEMMWPLPGETLQSFEVGLAKLCEIGADSFVIYPLLLMNNVELNQKRDEYGLVTIFDPDPNSEAEIVIQTNEVSQDAYREGHRYAYAVTSLYTLRGLWCLGRYLQKTGKRQYVELFRAFVEFYKKNPDHPYSRFCEDSIKAIDFSKFDNVGTLLHLTLHAEREVFDDLLVQFVKSQDFWADPVARFFFEVDLVNRPYVYRNTKIVPKKHKLEKLKVLSVTPSSYMVEVPAEHLPALREYLGMPESESRVTRFEVSYRRSQMPFMPNKSLGEHYSYCQDVSQRMGSLLPVWKEAGRPAAAKGAPAARA
ncbi:MAG: cobalamin-dependent protein [Byssovorax sp.]